MTRATGVRDETFVLEAPKDGSDTHPRSQIRGRATWPNPDPRTELPWVLILHGFKGFIDWGFFPLLAQRLAESGVASIAFNTSGSGVGPDFESFTELDAFAHASLTRQLEDIDRVADLAASGKLGLPIGLDATRRGLFGHSRGGGAALIHAAERGQQARYGAVATWAALDSFDRWDAPSKDLWRRLGQLPLSNARTGQEMPIDVSVLDDYEANIERLDVLAACARVHSPVLALHGDADETVDPSALERIHAALPAGPHERLSIPATGHTFGAKHPLVDVPAALERALNLTVTWFQDRLSTPADSNSGGESVTQSDAGRT